MEQLVKKAEKKIGFMQKISRSGFTLVEIMVAIAVIGLLAAIVVPNFRSRQPGFERRQFIGQLNALLRLASQQAIVSRKVHRIYCDLKKYTVTAQVRGEGKDPKGEPVFNPIKAPYLHHTISWPKQLSPKQFIIEGVDEMDRGGKKLTEAWFYIVPEGLAQNVIINFVDTRDKERGKPKQVGLVLNPFSVQFTVHDTFQK